MPTSGTFWVLHHDAAPMRRAPRPPRWRFDVPDAGSVYACSSVVGAFAECYGDTGVIPARDAGRILSRVEVAAPGVPLVRLDRPGCLMAYGLDARIGTELPYTRTRRWAERLREWWPDAGGLAFTPRRAASDVNVCLYADRAAAGVTVAAAGPIGGLPAVLADVLDALPLTVMFDF